MISNKTIQDTAYQIMGKAAIDIPQDYRKGIEFMVQKEDGLSKFVLKTITAF